MGGLGSTYTAMEVEIAVVCAIVVVICGWKVLDWVWLRPKKLERYLRQQGLRGNSYRLLFGDLKEMLGMIKEANSKPIGISDDTLPRTLPFQHKHIQNYGKNSFMWVGPKPAVNIMDPELIKEILNKSNDFLRPKENPLFRLIASGLVDHEGEKWARHRKLMNPAFHQEKLKNMLPAFHLSCSEMVGKWEKMVMAEGRGEIDVWPHLQTLTADVISRTAFGSSYEEGRKIFELLRELADYTFPAARSLYIPGWRFLPTTRNRKIHKLHKEVQALVRGVIDRRMKAIEAGKAKNGELLSILLQSNLNEIKLHGNKNVGMTIKDIIDECKLFYFAGQETTSSLIVWTMVLLSRYPAWQTRAREEVLQVFGNKTPDFDGLSHLKVVTMVLYEVLRLYPPAVVLTRAAREETKLGNISVPVGVQLSIPLILVHQDHELWGEDAKEFKPERFSEGVSRATKSQLSFCPFSWGPRICIGQNFALLEAKMAMAMILQRFYFEFSPSYVHAPEVIAALQPQHGVHLILHKI